MHTTRIFALEQVCRCIHTNHAKYNISKQKKVFNKLINKNQSKRDPLESLIDASPSMSSEKQLSIHTRRRMNALNKIFMKHITDMMSTGEIEPEILNRDIEISHVKITADFKVLNVYWIDNYVKNSDTEELLRKCAFELRHQLSQLRVIGNVPPIQFVKARGIKILKEVEEKLSAIDFGEDYTPRVYPNAIHQTVSAPVKSNKDEQQTIEDLNTLEDTFSVSLPLMKHDVFGLDQHRIMSKIKASLNKARKAQNTEIKNLQSETISVKQFSQEVPSFLTDREQSEQFAKFLSERRREQRRKNRRNRSKNNNFIDDFQEKNDDYDDYDIDYVYDDEEYEECGNRLVEELKESR